MERLSTVAVSVCVLAAAGCGGEKCGFTLVPGYEFANDAGVVAFGTAAVGSSLMLDIPVVDRGFGDTINGATVTVPGAVAFAVTTLFPLTVPAGAKGSLAVTFTPLTAGLATATLVLQTAAMGPSPLALQGNGQ